MSKTNLQSKVDYDSHPTEIVKPGVLSSEVGIQQLREKIPRHCFKPSYVTSFYYLFRDIFFAITLGLLAFYGIRRLPSVYIRAVVWALYGYSQGLVLTGLWVLGHECGHMTLSPSRTLNDAVGFILHSSLLTPYFSWKSTHRRHHIYANNLDKDHNYVPPTRTAYIASLIFSAQRLEELTEDSPFVILIRIMLQQLLGFPWYLLTNITAAQGSLHQKQSDSFLGNSHFLPTSTLFRPEEASLVIMSDLGTAAMAFVLWYCSSTLGLPVMLLYVQPWLWVNHWIVAITYLHHTHPNLPKYDNEVWTFLRGATPTMDRNFGWTGRYFFHNIIDYHVIHHLFPRIPFYHAEEATEAIIPLLGKYYHCDRSSSFLFGIWIAFTKCQWVEPDRVDVEPKDRVMWYRGGPSPPPETSMGRKGWKF
ncbi:delta-12 fatty acid desaturas-like protein [Melanomma pulvis-pyrius CBS 109.77]|uniref:Delta-12 fatty acid desaturas-like protein n=1 Tax=Melanomma pulvis-pyrius CBS 109.77 TaxID=1314802 RepID=A0A6A6XB59_9PLEO|nr:delta-12 fatty acid desaturas-like protein [Melanomma pulvis-pyrius CBS 109.77]